MYMALARGECKLEFVTCVAAIGYEKCDNGYNALERLREAMIPERKKEVWCFCFQSNTCHDVYVCTHAFCARDAIGFGFADGRL